jgi:hypothetical protein
LKFSSFTARYTTRLDRSMVKDSTTGAPCLPLSLEQGCRTRVGISAQTTYTATYTFHRS